ncbi:MAG TPA: pyridoxal-phosphate dependent enzyme [Nitrososphaerales archaeon]|nr:pyridoxal-phosphate dependent enzyme [Nitrososphaerales archaeon]
MVRTPLVPASRFDDDGVYLKLECLQPTGSFKVRGAWNRVSTSTEAERKDGFVTVSAGNHGQALAWASKKVGAKCTVYVPEDAVERKVESIRSMGATIVRRPHQEIMESMSDDRMTKLGMTFVHPFADPKVVAGQGTIGLEILEDKGEIRTVVVPVGGGGLVNGIAQAIKPKRPGVKFYGVQAEGSDPLPKSLLSGVAEDVGNYRTIADGIGATRVYDYMLPLFKKNLEGAFTVNDEEMKLAMGRLAKESHVVAEPAGAAGLAGLLKHRKELEEPIVCIISGGNVDPRLMRQILDIPNRKETS